LLIRIFEQLHRAGQLKQLAETLTDPEPVDEELA
jgi:hypothetical protein